jgi:hypothetical protein
VEQGSGRAAAGRAGADRAGARQAGVGWSRPLGLQTTAGFVGFSRRGTSPLGKHRREQFIHKALQLSVTRKQQPALILFAIGMMGVGILALRYADFALVWQPVPA